MKKIKERAFFWLFCAAMMGAAVHILGPEAIASEDSESWRGTYDTVMLWLNFGILVFIIVKFGRMPIMNFLKGRKEELSHEISALEEEKEAAFTKIREASEALDESEAHFEHLKQRSVKQGEKKRQEIIEDAQHQSQVMLEAAKQKVESQIVQAKRTFRSKLIDSAIDLATNRISKKIIEEDHQKLVDDYLAEVSKG
ncbi:MAG: hypothetical protein B6245_20020 [Desulfobacteraceae bacterium 4572_88]|nr:MAG: hypothetical protein B6245_20020 [Desulfobacteraceae bacterium 4572_88]RLC13200.1 MAG: hypothetical protein DRI57_16680 [Deltaproteobacteria bacterium]